MERTMRNIQPEPEPERTETSEARIGSRAGFYESPEPYPVRMPDIFTAPAQPKRWVAHRKAEIVTAVRGGYLSLSEACMRYALSIEEYLTWEREIDLSGLPGLRMNRTQHRRRTRVGSAES
jgi:hypothetical protein